MALTNLYNLIFWNWTDDLKKRLLEKKESVSYTANYYLNRSLASIIDENRAEGLLFLRVAYELYIINERQQKNNPWSILSSLSDTDRAARDTARA